MINKYLTRFSADMCRYKAKKTKKWSYSNSKKILFITENTKICNSQVYPFYLYKKEISRSLGSIEFREINIDRLEQYYKMNEMGGADIIFFQPWFDKGHELIIMLLTQIRAANPKAIIIFLDSYSPLDLRLANVVSPLIDRYIKKHVFIDRKNYSESTYGDTNLVEYYNNLYGLPQEDIVKFNIPDDFLGKLVVGPGFFTCSKMLPALSVNLSTLTYSKKINVHARLAQSGTGWYQKMREHALLACQQFKVGSIVTSDFVSYSTYMKELRSSRICFSPFGYGEACWRDYEAIMSGALLIKPDMSHIESDPNIFIPFETYIPVAWDFSDLAEKVNYYLEHEDERKRITRVAYDVLYNYDRDKEFVKQLSTLVM
ncbi:MAG: hypothetical protein COA95_11110 [Methylophaga sp.]|nr:MAG: hypothetical protein COA95_11110 [Methylophaga sp.]